MYTEHFCRSSEAHLRSLFSKYGVVQTCIVNVDKRHAFIKMITRQDAVNAREGMESYKSGDMQLRVSFCERVDVFRRCSDIIRPDGVSDSVHETVVTIRQASVSYQSSDLRKQIVSGCSPLNMVEQEGDQLSLAWWLRNLTLKSVLVFLRRVRGFLSWSFVSTR